MPGLNTAVSDSTISDTYGTWLTYDGIVRNKLAKVMGHEDIATTMQSYVRRTEDHDAMRNRDADQSNRNAAVLLPDWTGERSVEQTKQTRPWPSMQVRRHLPSRPTRRGGGIRTHGLFVPNEARYQAAPHPA